MERTGFWSRSGIRRRWRMPLRVIDRSSFAGRMGCRGREIVVPEFSEEKVIQQTLALYRQLLSTGAPMNADTPVREI
jgi:hypothetical protein